jgi:hypothetical protein
MAKAGDVPDKEAKKQLNRLRNVLEEEAIEHQQAYLNITAMMDMMTILLVFLLKQFSIQASAASMADGLQLPQSIAEKARPPAVNVTVSQTAILVEGDAVTQVRSGSVDPASKRDGANGFYITPLVDTLTKHATGSRRSRRSAARSSTAPRW